MKDKLYNSFVEKILGKTNTQNPCKGAYYAWIPEMER